MVGLAVERGKTLAVYQFHIALPSEWGGGDVTTYDPVFTAPPLASGAPEDHIHASAVI